MKKFTFRLETVRQLRESQEQAASRTYFAALRETERIHTLLTSISAEIHSTSLALSQHHQHPGGAGRSAPAAPPPTALHTFIQRNLRAWIDHLQAQQNQLRAQLAHARHTQFQAHSSLITATRRRKIMDRLRATHRSHHQKAIQAADQKLLDDTASRSISLSHRSPL